MEQLELKEMGSADLYTACEEQILAQAAKILERRSIGMAFNSLAVVEKVLMCQMAAYTDEVFGVVWLNQKHEVIAYEDIAKGSLAGCSVYPRTIIRQALKCNAAAVVLYHNHPSGNPEPSDEDKQITAALKDYLKVIEVRVLDHIVVGDAVRGCYSFAAHGLL